MNKIFTLLIFVFLSSAMLFGQCPDSATPNPSNKTFNMTYATEVDRDAAWDALASITFPAGAGCMCGDTIIVLKTDLTVDGPVGADDAFRIRAVTSTDDYFGGENGNFTGTLTFNYADNTTETCEYVSTPISNINENTSVNIFPNPANNQLTIINGEGQATIYNVIGEAVKHLTIDVNQVSIQLADLLNGQYYLKVLKKDGTIITKQFSKVD